MTQSPPAQRRVFLFLQGPHGPFFSQLANQLQNAGAETWRVGFNAGDRAFWPQRDTYIPYRGTPEDWAARLQAILVEKQVTDLVLYGDVRPIHAQAAKIAREKSLRVHVFEEGYLRPYWVTYELGGSNGHSRLMDLSVAQIQGLQQTRQFDPPVPPSHWGDMREHIFYGAVYHWFVLALNRSYPRFRPHRSLNVSEEFKLYVKRLLLMPWHYMERWLATVRIRLGDFPYHLALLQLEHDSSFQLHGPFDNQRAFLDTVITGFARGAPAHHHLVFKAHPLEDGRAPVRADIREIARREGVSKRVHFVRGGKLAGLLDEARSAITVNSTAGQQALWRGIPLRAFGKAVYSKPELVSDQNLRDFFNNPKRPDVLAYRDFRDFLLSTSQLPGSFYASKGRRQVLRRVADMMLRGQDPYTVCSLETEALRQQLHMVQ